MKELEKKSITEFINNNSGKTGINFYMDLYEEDPSNYIELTEQLNDTILKGKLKILSFEVSLNEIKIYTDKGIKEQSFNDFKTLGLNDGDMLNYFRLINELFFENNISERLIIYYDELIPDTHWIGLIDKKISHELFDFVKNYDSNDCQDYIVDGVRVLGVGLADEDGTRYKELVIHPE
ncbi:hypothetical protein JM658_16985 [Joostella atrarenae]|uniref:Uncharacterized protein n=1 Tax=Joostella atrarenae TaxID=679257 RepID=A0ABS9J7X9_9FLAO|nr:hypothetical protein [Joostella atrarenae]MCF8716520.1 hypothetical protein [Joostella atrarenae]